MENIIMFIFHAFMTIITGGIWLIVLLLWALVKFCNKD